MKQFSIFIKFTYENIKQKKKIYTLEKKDMEKLD